MIREEDDHALSFGRYFRAARFQVINPKLTIASYEREFKLILERFAFLDERETEALKEALYTFIEFTMCISWINRICQARKSSNSLPYIAFITFELCSLGQQNTRRRTRQKSA